MAQPKLGEKLQVLHLRILPSTRRELDRRAVLDQRTTSELARILLQDALGERSQPTEKRQPA